MYMLQIMAFYSLATVLWLPIKINYMCGENHLAETFPYGWLATYHLLCRAYHAIVLQDLLFEAIVEGVTKYMV